MRGIPLSGNDEFLVFLENASGHHDIDGIVDSAADVLFLLFIFDIILA